MPRLDSVIAAMFQEGASELVFETGTGAWMRTPAGIRVVFKQSLTTQQIIGAFAEIVQDEARADFPPQRPLAFVYPAPAGAVDVQMDGRADEIKVRVAPHRGEPPAPAALLRAEAAAASPTEELLRPVPAARQTWAVIPEGAPPGEAAQAVELHEAPAQYRYGDPPAAMAELLSLLAARGGSDLHLTSGRAPVLRVDGVLEPLEGYAPPGGERLREMLFSLAPAPARERWVATRDADFACEQADSRFRVNLYEERGGIAAAVRRVPREVPSAEQLGLSPAVLELCALRKGLVLVTGPTGSGKSTTLAAMVDHANRTRDDHILTIEDPVEFVHPSRRCLVHQREVGTHTASFGAALRAALREDPDIVLVGELRDLETTSIALETAETGHLVFGTLHTNTAPSTVDRIVDQFPADRQPQVRLMLAETLRGVVSQVLCRRIGGGRVAAREVLLGSGAVGNLIREGKTFQIPSVMQTSRSQGMCTLNDSLFELVRHRLVEPGEALGRAVARAEFRTLLERAGLRPA